MTEMILLNKRLLVPPARPEANPLLQILQRLGAEVVEFPTLHAVRPTSFEALDRALGQCRDYQWLLFSGSNSVLNFLDRLANHGRDASALAGPRIGAIGHGTVSALKKRGIGLDYIAQEHTAAAVVAGMAIEPGNRVLLIREEQAGRGLPASLAARGATVTEVAGYRMDIEAAPETARPVFERQFDLLALANPTAARFLAGALQRLGLDPRQVFKKTTIAAVGQATADQAMQLGLTPTIISKGHIADLGKSIADFFRERAG